MSDEMTKQALEKCRDTGLFLQERPLGVNDTDLFGDTPLHIVSSWGDAESVAALLAAGAKVDAMGDKGQTPLFQAKSTEVVDLLLAAGADPSIVDEFGETAETFRRNVGPERIAAHIALRSKR